jgi:uncharacterized membrane protein YfcA
MILLGYAGIFAAGLVLGLLGGGGSVLGVPILVYLFRLPASAATTYSLLLVGSSSLIGVVAYLRQRLVDFRAGTLFLLPSLLGVLLARRILLPALPDELFRAGAFVLTKDRLVLLVFAAVMGAAAHAMLCRTGKNDAKRARGRPTKLLGAGLVAGLVMGFVGAGGGFLVVPVLVRTAHLDMKRAVATSLFVLFGSAWFGVTSDGLTGASIDGAWASVLVSVSFAGVIVGTILSSRTPAHRLKRWFAYLVAVIALAITVKELLF